MANIDLENYVKNGQLFQYDISSRTYLADDVAKTAKSLGYDVVKMPDDLGSQVENVAYVVVNEKSLLSPTNIIHKAPVTPEIKEPTEKVVTPEMVKPTEKPIIP